MSVGPSDCLRREGRYLLRTHLTETDPVKLWNHYLRLVQVEEAFRTLKSELAIRPIFYQDTQRIEASVRRLPLVLSVRHARATTQRLGTRTHRAQRAREICRRADGRCAHPDHRRERTSAHRCTQPEPELELLLERLRLTFPAQPRPNIRSTQAVSAHPLVQTFGGAP
jgi:hypothetical protein